MTGCVLLFWLWQCMLRGGFVVKEVQVGLCRWGPGVVCVD